MVEFFNTEGAEHYISDNSKRTKIYYLYHYSSWEQGNNENTNKLIRKFIKKEDDISKLAKAYIKRIKNDIITLILGNSLT